MASEDPVASVVWLIRGAWVTMSVRAGCSLEIFDRLDVRRETGELARETRSDPGALGRLLVVLGDLGLVDRDDAGRWGCTPRGETLRADHPSGTRNLALMQSWLPNVGAWGGLADALQDGGAVFERVNGAPMWEHLAAHPDMEAIFDASMSRRAAGQVESILQSCDLSDVSSIVDVGGGRGAMLAGLLRAHPHLTGVVADRPDVAARADTLFAEAGLADRGRGVGADFFASVPPGADLYTISNVLHDWDDEECVAILRTVRAAMGPGSRLLVVERLLDAERSFEEQRDLHLLDLNMLVLFGARERTKAEYDAVLVAAGFTPGTVADTSAPWNVIEASPAPER